MLILSKQTGPLTANPTAVFWSRLLRLRTQFSTLNLYDIVSFNLEFKKWLKKLLSQLFYS